MINSTHAIINMEIMLSCHIFTAISGKVPGTHLPILVFGGPPDMSPEHIPMAGWRFSVLVTSPTVTKVTVHLSAAGRGPRRRTVAEVAPEVALAGAIVHLMRPLSTPPCLERGLLCH